MTSLYIAFLQGGDRLPPLVSLVPVTVTLLLSSIMIHKPGYVFTDVQGSAEDHHYSFAAECAD